MDEMKDDGVHVRTIMRVRFELILLSFLILILWALPWQPASTGFQLFLYKMVLFSASQLVAYVSRKIMYPYIDFSTSPDTSHKALVIVFHASAAYVFASGG
jgi:hypothetical protein